MAKPPRTSRSTASSAASLVNDRATALNFRAMERPQNLLGGPAAQVRFEERASPAGQSGILFE